MASLTVSQTTPAAGNANKQREGAEIITGAEACYEHSKELLKGLGFPGGVMPLRGLEECGLVRETGYVWMRQGKPYEHHFRATGTRVRYDAEVTAYVEEGRMKRMTGVRSKQMMLWVPIVEMSLDGADKVYFKSNVGIGRSFPAAAFADEDAAADDAPAPAGATEANDKH
ncbi:hypothetical protein CFC21_006715 [Triticum aestivum]|uniref:DUF538 family protein n=3 Tax=Triticum TaxID=4564 RepID=A0A9R0QV87_TRITD|nr:uncharacterized protein LOC119336468 [Triticum dicoccoides]XP_044401028.1 uncharacterized protein LOC123124476 [Triticum aestivum]KAF6989372.1 hypothetical protein CFC21_006715 [Triticum aestivum]VAH17184.1 unnamed protein product [Triticum turgidum subsp. durum]